MAGYDWQEDLMGAVDRRRDELIDFTRELVRVPSENPGGSEAEVAKVIVAKMKDIGVEKVEVLEKERDRSNVLGNITGSKKDPLLILNAHIDTKPVGEKQGWSVDPFSGEIRDGELYGRGAVDMKATAAAMIIGAAAIKDVGLTPSGTIQLAMTADEETGGGLGVGWLVMEKGLRADAAIVGEPSGVEEPFEYLDISTRGVYAFDLVVRGSQMHSSLSDIKGGVNSSVKLSKVLSGMQSDLKLRHEPSRLYPQGPTINPGVFLKGGVWYGVLPGLSVAGNDIRILPSMSKERIAEDIEHWLDKLRAEDSKLDVAAELKLWVEGAEISEQEPIVKACFNSYQRVFGREPKIGGFPGGVDARFMINQGKFPAVPAFGPGFLHVAHGPDERVPVEDVVRAAKIYAMASLEYLGVS